MPFHQSPNTAMKSVIPHPTRVTTASTAHHGTVTTSLVPARLLAEPFACCQSSSVFANRLPLSPHLSDSTMQLLIPNYAENRGHYRNPRLSKMANGWAITQPLPNGEHEMITCVRGAGLHPKEGEIPLTGTAELTHVAGTSTGNSPIIMHFDDSLGDAVAENDVDALQDAIHNVSICHSAETVAQAINAHVPLTEVPLGPLYSYAVASSVGGDDLHEQHPSCVFACPPEGENGLGKMFGRLLSASDALEMKTFFLDFIVNHIGSAAYLKARPKTQNMARLQVVHRLTSMTGARRAIEHPRDAHALADGQDPPARRALRGICSSISS